jgi:ribosomal-protein-alanine N-acetyltransferase
VSAQPGNATPIIRIMKSADLDTVALLESRNYEFPWGRGIFNDCLLASYFAVVLERGAEIMGYAIFSTAAAEGHILNLCVDEGSRSMGYGQQLLEYLLEYAEDIGIERLFLEVRPSNEAALNLYDRAGFNRLGVRKGYYRTRKGREDALVLAKELCLPPD